MADNPFQVAWGHSKTLISGARAPNVAGRATRKVVFAVGKGNIDFVDPQTKKRVVAKNSGALAVGKTTQLGSAKSAFKDTFKAGAKVIASGFVVTVGSELHFRVRKGTNAGMVRSTLKTFFAKTNIKPPIYKIIVQGGPEGWDGDDFATEPQDPEEAQNAASEERNQTGEPNEEIEAETETESETVDEPVVEEPTSAVIDAAPWTTAFSTAQSNIEKLKQAIDADLASETPDVQNAVRASLPNLDSILDDVKDGLPDALARISGDKAAQLAAINEVKGVRQRYVTFLSSEKIKLVDANPFNVKTDLIRTLVGGLQGIDTQVKQLEKSLQ